MPLPTHPKLLDKSWVEEEYSNKRRTLDNIADSLGVSRSSVARALKRHGIKKNTPKSKYDLLNNDEWLINSYVNELKSTEEIAKIIGDGCTSAAVRWILKYRLKVNVRCHLEAQQIRFARGDEYGENSHNWKGGRYVNVQGYVAVRNPTNPKAFPNGYMLEHRLVMEKKLGRRLESYEIVHHIDGDKTNNHPDNLMLTVRENHRRTHIEALSKALELENKVDELEKILGEYRRLYGDLVEK